MKYLYIVLIIVSTVFDIKSQTVGDDNIVRTSLVAMTAYINGISPLALEQRNAHLNSVKQNYINNHTLVASDVFNYINTYEANRPPVYEDRNVMVMTDLPPETQLLLFLQQSLFDNEYQLSNVATLQGIKFEFADIFPGIVKPTAPRVSNASVEINASHFYNHAARTMHDIDDAKRPTGYYAAPGEVVTISIPASVINTGWKVMIGAHASNHEPLIGTNRFHRMNKVYPLSATTTQVVSPFGGGIYILIPLNTNLGWQNVGISGAVKSPFFSARSGRQTTPSVWVAELSARQVEWADIESDTYMMTLPVAHLTEIGLTDPTDLMLQWDRIIREGYDYTNGRTSAARKRSDYFIVDSRLPNDGAFGTGYPQVLGDGKVPYGPFGGVGFYPTAVLRPNFWLDGGIQTTFHEMGHGSYQPTIATEVESMVQIPGTFIFNQLYGVPIDTAFKYSLFEDLTFQEAAMDWMITPNFRTNKDMGLDSDPESFGINELQYQARGHAKYVDMAKLFGWQTVHNMNREIYNKWKLKMPEPTPSSAWSNSTTNQEVLEAACMTNNINVAPLFHFWGHAPSEALKEKLGTLQQSPKIFNELVAYYRVIPNNQAAFLPIKNKLLSRKDQVWHNRINSFYNQYDSQNYATEMRNQVCFIMQTYYSGNNYCSNPTIATTNDSFVGLSAGKMTPTVFKNDKAYSTIEASSDLINIPSVLNHGGLVGLTFNADGTANIPSNAANGFYQVTYKACLIDSPSICSQSTMSITLQSGTPDVVVSITAPTVAPANFATSQLMITVSNIGTVYTSAELTVTVSIPSETSFGVFPSLNNGWACTTNGNAATCKNAEQISTNATSNFIVPFIPNTNQVGNTLTIPPANISGGGEPIMNQSNNQSTSIQTLPVLPAVFGTSNTGSVLQIGGVAITNLRAGDLIGGQPASSTNSTISLVSVNPAGITLSLDNSSGALRVVSGASSGTYTFQYKLCDIYDNCSTITNNEIIVNTCNTGTTVGTATPNDLDADGINDACDLDDDNDGILDTNEEICNATNLDPNPSSTSYINSGNHVDVYKPQLDSPDGWGAADLDLNHFVGMMFGSPSRIIGVRTKGRTDTWWQYVTSYRLEGTKDGINWETIGTYDGNTDNNTLVYNATNNSNADWLGARIRPLTWSDWPVLRFQFELCNPTDKDTDNDTIADRLDLDSDGDACFDAIEGGANFGFTDIDTNGRLLGTFDTNGVPTVATALGQDLGSSANSSQQDATCTELSVTPESGIVASTGGNAILDVRANDLINGVMATNANSTVAKVGIWPLGIGLGQTGSVYVLNGTPAGTYTLRYKLCDLSGNCAEADNTVVVAAVVACSVSDTVPVIQKNE